MAVEARASLATGRPYLRALRRDAKQLLQLLALEPCELSMLLSDDAAIQQLNRDFRNKDKPTDVLSFEQDAGGLAPRLSRAASPPAAANRRGAGDAPSERPLLLGDIVISLETASRQALALGLSPAERLRTLLIHGVLHLIGYDHERSPADARVMFARERELAAALDAPASTPPRKRRELPPTDSIAAGTGAALGRGPRPRRPQATTVDVAPRVRSKSR